MPISFKRKMLMFFCNIFGHRIVKTWAFKGIGYFTCDRCRYVIEKKLEVPGES